jgi:Ca2+-dependent lipid-binding protein, contains C2 domain
MKFVPAGETDDQTEPPLIMDLEAILKEGAELIKGQLVVNVHHAKNLIPNDSTTSDPYCVVTWPGEKISTGVIKKTLNPIWKFTGGSKVSIPKNVQLFTFTLF